MQNGRPAGHLDRDTALVRHPLAQNIGTRRVFLWALGSVPLVNTSLPTLRLQLSPPPPSLLKTKYDRTHTYLHYEVHQTQPFVIHFRSCLMIDHGCVTGVATNFSRYPFLLKATTRLYRVLFLRRWSPTFFIIIYSLSS